jgi:hypothetical protein
MSGAAPEAVSCRWTPDLRRPMLDGMSPYDPDGVSHAQREREWMLQNVDWSQAPRLKLWMLLWPPARKHQTRCGRSWYREQLWTARRATRDDGGDDGSAGVREPRRPRPNPPAASVEAEEPGPDASN